MVVGVTMIVGMVMSAIMIVVMGVGVLVNGLLCCYVCQFMGMVMCFMAVVMMVTFMVVVMIMGMMTVFMVMSMMVIFIMIVMMLMPLQVDVHALLLFPMDRHFHMRPGDPTLY